MASANSLAGIVGAVGTLGIESYQLSQGDNVSTSLVGGVPVIQSGAASTQTTLLFVVIGLGLVLVLAYFFLR
jgi:hypothetical protein